MPRPKKNPSEDIFECSTYRSETVNKPEEECVIFLISGLPAFEGGPPMPLTPQEEHIAALQEKQRFEMSHGVEIYQFHRDPLAGGQRPARPVSEQLYKSSPMGADGKPLPMRRESFWQGPNGLISQGKVGAAIEDEHGNTVVMKSNIQRGQATMINVPAWVGVYIGSR